MVIEMERAIELLHGGQYTCVLCRGDETYTSTESGIKPLLGWLDDGIDLKGFCAADKVAGRAAAFLYIRLGVKEVYADVMSEAAAATFAKYGIKAASGVCVPNITNRAGTGNCPMEEAVKDVDEPESAERVLREKVLSMRTAR
jgi:hypothetical protein